MNKLVPTEQKCGVKNRNMAEIIRNLDTYRNESYDGYFMLIDQEKAFDRVNHKYMFETLFNLGITGKFLHCVKTLYTNITSQILVNGLLTEKINIERGVRQGCPLSMMLFVLTTIPLIEMIKDESEITGHITKRIHPIKVQCYADDVTVIIKHPKEFNLVLNIFKKHEKASGALINDNKTEIFRLGQPNKYETESMKSKKKYSKNTWCLLLQYKGE